MFVFFWLFSWGVSEFAYYKWIGSLIEIIVVVYIESLGCARHCAESFHKQALESTQQLREK